MLYDVAIINDTLAYAVGEIYKKDSLGNWIQPPYNFAKWNGGDWELKKVMYNYQGYDYYAQLRAIFTLGENDYWIGSNQPMHWNGSRWETFDLTSSVWNGWINKIWGTSSSNIFIIGNNGVIAHYDGTSWEKMESGTDVDLLDIWGTPDGSIVWACGREYFKPTVLLKTQNNTVEKVYEDYDHRTVVRGDTLSGILIGGMVKANNLFIYSSACVYQSPLFQTGRTRRLSFTPSLFNTTPSSIGGTGRNDFFIGGYFSFIVHFNGYTWHQFTELLDQNDRLYGLAVTDKLVMAVGTRYSNIFRSGLVVMGIK